MKSAFLGLCTLLMVSTTAALAQTADAPPAMVPNSFADLAANVQDSVVNVSTTQKMPQRGMRRGQSGGQGGMQLPQFPPGSPFQDFFEEFFNQQQGMGGMNNAPGDPDGDGGPEGDPRVQSLGSGFILDSEKGLVVTNNHVIEDADEIQVILHDDTKLKAKVLGRDADTDLALLKVESVRKLTAVSWGDSDTMRVGDWVLAVGNPFGLGGTVTSGIISARQRNINAGRYDDFIQTDASINRGNSGGPMFNMRGQVIGINTAIYSPSGGSVGIGFAIPSNLAKPVIDQLTKFGATHRGWIGVQIQDITPEIADSLGLKSTRGALVASLTPGGPAAKAGIKQGDIITKFGSRDLTAMRFLPRVVADAPIGQPTTVTVFRPTKNGATEMVLNITPGELSKEKADGGNDDENENARPEQAAPRNVDITTLGVHVAAATDALRQQFRLGLDVKGVIVTSVKRRSDAAEKGIVPGDVILEINQQPTSQPNDLVELTKAAKDQKKTSVLLLVNSQNNLRFVAIKLAE